MIYQQPVRYEYRLLKPPTLLIVGARDHTVPLGRCASLEARERMGDFVALGQAAVTDIPRATLVVVPNCGHIPHLERPQDFRPLLDFLRDGQ